MSGRTGDWSQAGRAWLSAFVAFVSVGPAGAADLFNAPAYKAPPAVVTPYNWTGFYVGGNAGYTWGREDTALNIVDGGTGAICHFCGTADVPNAQGSASFAPKGFEGGGQIGYNWQASNWVYGIEVDFEGSDQRQTINNSFPLLLRGIPVPTSCSAPPCTGNFSSSARTDWLFTARPRVGYAWDRTLVYATGGLALARASFSQSYADNVDFITFPPGGHESAAVSKTMVGFAVGGGLEQALGNRWSVRAEYLYTQFGGMTAFGRLSDGFPPDFSNFTNKVEPLSSHTVRLGINYSFDGT